MKVLIWISTFFVGTIINTLIGYVIGIRAGAVLLYIAEYFVAKKLCEKWDEHKCAKEASTVETSTKRVMPGEITTDNQLVYNQVDTTGDQTVSSQNETTVFKTIQYCRRCGFKLVEGSKFCSKCGTKIEKESGV